MPRIAMQEDVAWSDELITRHEEYRKGSPVRAYEPDPAILPVVRAFPAAPSQAME